MAMLIFPENYLGGGGSVRWTTRSVSSTTWTWKSAGITRPFSLSTAAGSASSRALKAGSVQARATSSPHFVSKSTGCSPAMRVVLRQGNDASGHRYEARLTRTGRPEGSKEISPREKKASARLSVVVNWGERFFSGARRGCRAEHRQAPLAHQSPCQD